MVTPKYVIDKRKLKDKTLDELKSMRKSVIRGLRYLNVEIEKKSKKRCHQQ